MLLGHGASVKAKLAAPNGDTPLHLVVTAYNGESKYLEAAKTLLAFGADVNAKNGRHRPPLHEAILLQSQHEDMIQLLLRYGGEIDEIDENEESASYYAELVSAYWWATSNNRPNIIRLLVEKNPRLVNETSEDGSNGLETYMRGHRAAYENDALFALFVKLGLNPFRRQQDDQLSCFELGIQSRRVINNGFLKACFHYLHDHIESLHITFRELRIATEINDLGPWATLQPFLKGIEHESDEDHWNIHHFLHQAEPRKYYSQYEVAAASETTLPPTTFGWPIRWEHWGEAEKPHIEVDGLEIVFRGKKKKRPETVGNSKFLNRLQANIS